MCPFTLSQSQIQDLYSRKANGTNYGYQTRYTSESTTNPDYNMLRSMEYPTTSGAAFVYGELRLYASVALSTGRNSIFIPECGQQEISGCTVRTDVTRTRTSRSGIKETAPFHRTSSWSSRLRATVYSPRAGRRQDARAGHLQDQRTRGKRQQRADLPQHRIPSRRNG